MAKAKIEDIASRMKADSAGMTAEASQSPSSAGMTAETLMKQAAEPRRFGVATILYSLHRDVYKIPSAGVDLWLSVQVYPGSDLAGLGTSADVAETADGKGLRSAYRHWAIIAPGATAAIPADDPMVVDYLRQVKAEEL